MSMFYQKPEDVLSLWDRLKGLGAQASAYAGIPGDYGNAPGNPYDDTLEAPRPWHPMDVIPFLGGFDTIPMNPEERIGRQAMNAIPMPFLDEGLGLAGRFGKRGLEGLGSRFARTPSSGITQSLPNNITDMTAIRKARQLEETKRNWASFREQENQRLNDALASLEDFTNEYRRERFKWDNEDFWDEINSLDEEGLIDELTVPPKGPQAGLPLESFETSDFANLPPYVKDWMDEGAGPIDILDFMARAGKPQEEIDEVARRLGVDDAPPLGRSDQFIEVYNSPEDIPYTPPLDLRTDPPTQDLLDQLEHEAEDARFLPESMFTQPLDADYTGQGLDPWDRTMDFMDFINQDIVEPKWKRLMKENDQWRQN